MAYYTKNETICQAILDAVVAEYTAQAVEIPQRQFRGYAGMPLDCELLSVYYSRMYSVATNVGPDAEAYVPERPSMNWGGTEIDIVLLRCTPQPTVVRDTVRPLSTTVIEDFASLMESDPHIIRRGVLNAWEAGSLGLGANVAMGDTAPIGDESGMLVGIRGRVRVGLLL